jgi:hypothetical protein
VEFVEQRWKNESGAVTNTPLERVKSPRDKERAKYKVGKVFRV